MSREQAVKAVCPEAVLACLGRDWAALSSWRAVADGNGKQLGVGLSPPDAREAAARGLEKGGSPHA